MSRFFLFEANQVIVIKYKEVNLFIALCLTVWWLQLLLSINDYIMSKQYISQCISKIFTVSKILQRQKTTSIYGHIKTTTPVRQYYVNSERSQMISCLHCACFRVHSLSGQGQWHYVCFQGYRCKTWAIFIDVINMDIIG